MRNKKNKMTINDAQLRSMIKECLKKSMSLNEERGEFNISIGTGGGYYGDSSIFSYDGETYSFHPSGWDFNTDSQLEAAAVMSSSDKSFWVDDQLYDIPIDDNLTDYDLECGAYWMTGGNRIWRFGADEYLNASWDEAKDEVTDACRDHLMECWSNSSNFHDLIANLVAKQEDFFYALYEDCGDLFRYEDDEEEMENDEDMEQQDIQEGSKAKKIIREYVEKVLNEERGFQFKEGDKVIVHGRNGETMNGTIEDYDYNIMSWKPQYDIELENGKTVVGVPEGNIELVSASSDEEYRTRMSKNKFIRDAETDDEDVLNESVVDGEFAPHGYRTASNAGGMEVEVADSGDAARFRMSGGDGNEPTDWLEIQYNEEDEPYCVLPNGNEELLSNYTRY